MNTKTRKKTMADYCVVFRLLLLIVIAVHCS